MKKIVVVTLEIGKHFLPVEVRLRHLLKRAKRDWGLECVSIKEDEILKSEKGTK